MNLVCKYSRIGDGNLDFRFGKEDEVVESRKKFLENIGMRMGNCVTLQQMHGDEVRVVGGKDGGKMFKADALVTKEKNVVLFLLTADCFPVILYDEKAEILGLVHLGWQGVDRELVTKVAGKMTSLGAREMLAIVGPGIRKESYVFNVPLIQENDPKWQSFLTKLGDGRTSIDLTGFIKKQLVDCGVKEIEDCGMDTVKDKNYFSHYRAVRTGEPEGRFATIATMV